MQLWPKEIIICFFKSLYTKNNLESLANLNNTIAIRNGKLVWKQGPNGPFYALMLRSKLFYNPFFSIVHQNINKRKGWDIKTVCELPFYLPFYLPTSEFVRKNVAFRQRKKLALYQTQNRNGGPN